MLPDRLFQFGRNYTGHSLRGWPSGTFRYVWPLLGRYVKRMDGIILSGVGFVHVGRGLVLPSLFGP